ncbi:leucyl aminopeptidase [Tumebacillus sp. DT12]|uniref:Probable cytosol aminopeptidase n=1 Tax=Tumebacillus lacus TaxID=2995335 RepID=A0ABT3WXT1_9BACL|nr:leucyl aminopeptidase [Tumebacillus lacus]MCX7569021.1 leucyl aminopeptidase [Tumebacillus lacus]
MDFQLTLQPITEVEADVLIVNLFEGVTALGGATGALDAALDGQISALIAAGDLTGRFKETRTLYPFGKIKAQRVLVVGLGEREEFHVNRARHIAAAAARATREFKPTRIATIVHGAGSGGLDVTAAAQALAEGTVLGLYKVKTLKKHEAKETLQSVLVVENDASKEAAIQQGLKRGLIIAQATNFSRDVINEPANTLTPTRLAELATEVANRHGLGIQVLEEAEMRELGMNALLGIGQGSDQPSKLIVITHNGAPESEEKIAYVGKGITFDTGGYSMKPPAGMELMKTDMGGAGTVLGAMEAIGALKPKANIMMVIPAAENMVSGNAIKPGDVVVAMNGKSIEIVNTDAEGRVVLADALTWAVRNGATKIVDAATLTGAISIALGRQVGGLFSNDTDWAAVVKEAFHQTGERVWELPLVEEYSRQYNSNVADMKNSGGRDAGSIVGAMILREFVENTPWVHLDIAGTARDAEGTSDLHPKGATGFGVRTLVQLAENLGE